MTTDLIKARALRDGIINRKDAGSCHFEAAIMEIEDTALALEAIRCKMRQMQGGN